MPSDAVFTSDGALLESLARSGLVEPWFTEKAFKTVSLSGFIRDFPKRSDTETISDAQFCFEADATQRL